MIPTAIRGVGPEGFEVDSAGIHYRQRHLSGKKRKRKRIEFVGWPERQLSNPIYATREPRDGARKNVPIRVPNSILNIQHKNAK